MKRSTSRIQTTHAGSLPRPDDLIGLNRARSGGEREQEAAFSKRLASAVADTVRQQREVGIDIPDDGEFGKSTTRSTDYGPWLTYAYPRLNGFIAATPVADGARRMVSGLSFCTSFWDRRDMQKFGDFYRDPQLGSGFVGSSNTGKAPACTGPVSYCGQQAVQSDIKNLRAAMTSAGIDEAFMCSASPGVLERCVNSHYERDEEFLYAIGEAMREEYRAIIDAGLILQIDDPGLPDTWDQANPQPSLDAYKTFAKTRIEALNHALRGLPEERIRYHICWGSWHGPHTSDIPIHEVVDLVLSVHAGAYSVEAGNARHEHEWKVWRGVTLPPGKVLIPGVVSHATNVVEHPELVADRIVRFAEIVGRENVIAGTDCGLGGRIHPQIAWAKLQSLVEGAQLATKQLWR